MSETATRESLILRAALSPDPRRATASWLEWSSMIALEDAPYPELRLLPRVYANLSKLAPEFRLPEKLRGKARATFTRNQLLARGAEGAVSDLAAVGPVMLVKGAAICSTFNSWSSRAMGDIDIAIPLERLDAALASLSRGGWIPKYGMTWASLLNRAPLRRNSWNVTRGNADLDIHWRLIDGGLERRLRQHLWSTAQKSHLFDVPVLVPSPAYCVIASLRHGFAEGTHGDRMQTYGDILTWLPRCNTIELCRLIDLTETWEPLQRVVEVLTDVGCADVLPAQFRAPRSRTRPSSPSLAQGVPLRVEKRLLRRPFVYTIWSRLGRRSKLERAMLWWLGPMSRPLAEDASATSDYDLRECSVIDQLAGPGWGWPEPEHTCFWTDGADSRLLIPLRRKADHVIVLDVDGLHRRQSPYPLVHVFANGVLVTALHLDKWGASRYVIPVRRRLLFGEWVEVSFRPAAYPSEATLRRHYVLRRSLPAARLRVFPWDGDTRRRETPVPEY